MAFLLRGAVAGVLLLVFSFLGAGPVQGQAFPRYPDARIRQLDYKNSGGEVGVSFFHYDRQGVLRRSIWTLADSTRFSQGIHRYDQQGREVQKYREFNDGLTSTENYVYDEVGRRSAETFTRSDGVSGRADYEFDEQGRVRVMHCRKHKGWLEGDINYHYEEGRLVGADISRDGQRAGVITYTYDGQGRLKDEHWDFNGRWSQTFGYIYEADPGVVYAQSSPLLEGDPGRLVVAETYDWCGQTGGPSAYTYTPDGRLAEKVFTRSDGLRTVTRYRHDGRGNLVAATRRHDDGTSTEFLFKYDAEDRLVAKTFRRSDGMEGSETYTYDLMGRLATAAYRNQDFWLTGDIAFQHDAWGRLRGGRFTGQDGPDAEITMTTDTRGNVTEVHWVFASGKTQTYRYTY